MLWHALTCRAPAVLWSQAHAGGCGDPGRGGCGAAAHYLCLAVVHRLGLEVLLLCCWLPAASAAANSCGVDILGHVLYWSAKLCSCTCTAQIEPYAGSLYQTLKPHLWLCRLNGPLTITGEGRNFIDLILAR